MSKQSIKVNTREFILKAIRKGTKNRKTKEQMKGIYNSVSTCKFMFKEKWPSNQTSLVSYTTWGSYFGNDSNNGS